MTFTSKNDYTHITNITNPVLFTDICDDEVTNIRSVVHICSILQLHDNVLADNTRARSECSQNYNASVWCRELTMGVTDI